MIGPVEIIAGLFLLALLVLIVSGLVFGLARGIIWWQQRRDRQHRPMVREQWELSDRECDGGGKAA